MYNDAQETRLLREINYYFQLALDIARVMNVAQKVVTFWGPVYAQETQSLR